MKKEKKYKKLLLVEGKDDEHVIYALCTRFNVQESFNVIDCKGYDNLNQQIPIRFKQSEIESIGIIIDADTDVGNRWISMKNMLESAGFSIPNVLPPTGLIATNGDVKVGVWIMPNNNINGMIEDFISFLVPSEDELMPIVHSTLTEIENQNLNKYAIHHKSKAVIHSWLSLQEDPGTPMGLGITKRYLSTEPEICNALIGWINELFNN